MKMMFSTMLLSFIRILSIEADYAKSKKLTYCVTLGGQPTSLDDFLNLLFNNTDLALCGNNTSSQEIQLYRFTNRYCDDTDPKIARVRSCQRICGRPDLTTCKEKCSEYHECVWGTDPQFSDFCKRFYKYPDKFVESTTEALTEATSTAGNETCICTNGSVEQTLNVTPKYETVSTSTTNRPTDEPLCSQMNVYDPNTHFLFDRNLFYVGVIAMLLVMTLLFVCPLFYCHRKNQKQVKENRKDITELKDSVERLTKRTSESRQQKVSTLSNLEASNRTTLL